MLDSSLCSKRHRIVFLQHIASKGAVLNGQGDSLKSEHLWNSSRLRRDDVNSSPFFLNWLSKRKVKIKQVYFTNENLSFSLKSINLTCLESFHLSLSNCIQPNTSRIIKDTSVKSLINCSPKITAINISNGGLVLSESGLLSLLESYGEKLRILSIGFSSVFSTKLVMSSIAQNQTLLTSLHISASKDFDDTDVELICARCSRLTCLDISRNPELTAIGTGHAIVNGLPELKCICFEQTTTQGTADLFKILIRRFSKFLSLDLLNHIAVGVPVLIPLNLSKNEVITEINRQNRYSFGDDVFNINDRLHFIPACNLVESVCMPESIIGHVLDTFIWHCSTNITSLNLQGCRDMNDAPGPNLNMTDSSLFVMSLKCSLLTSINFSFREYITDEGMTALVANNVQLRNIFCVGCYNIGAVTVNSIATFCKALEIINLSGCGDIDGESLLSLAQNCSRLVHVGLRRIETINANIAEAVVVELVSKCGELQNVQFSPPHYSYSSSREIKLYLMRPGRMDYVPQLAEY